MKRGMRRAWKQDMARRKRLKQNRKKQMTEQTVSEEFEIPTVRLRGKIPLTKEFISNVLITAFDGNYGGSWYWAAPANDDWLTTERENGDTKWVSVTIIDKEDGDDPYLATHTVSGLNIADGLTAMLEMGGEWARDVFGWLVDQDDADIDAEAADQIVQFALFNSIVYG